MRDWISWVNDELTQMWPILLVAAPFVVGWWRQREARKRTETLTLIRDVIHESAGTSTGMVKDLKEVREQVANDHKSNLREDIDALHHDVRLLTGLVEQHLEWSQEWSSSRDGRIDALESTAANPLPPL